MIHTDYIGRIFRDNILLSVYINIYINIIGLDRYLIYTVITDYIE